ncbi:MULTISPECIES: hypothetical protein [unclassified Okeania]|uniref:hypothetical protein n=1 Tax=unclassified Okeania TaxID=2634635 RepID=UPI0013BB4F89|nr:MULTISPECIES: hypothetical protein [unclassified Okeania]NES78204.1 hypothetical protein [Okeania sp. SIO1H4]NET13316.1 hypothetical protein [Okeania sp. SIO1H6]NET18734.1 hypothetical protein [Okeania sp. SIO1H5]NET93226.1 hypothetical protein [Okeania sp. SIO1H2]
MLKSLICEGRRQETTHPQPLPGGEDRRQDKWVFRGGRSKNCKNDFSAQLCA